MRQTSSRERMLAVFHCEEPDHVPLLFSSFGFIPPPGLRWSTPVEEAQAWLSLGVDAWFSTGPPHQLHPDVTVREWQETPHGGGRPVMIKEYLTSAGTFRQEVFRTDDWLSPDWPTHAGAPAGVQLFDDYNVPRYRRCPIETEADVDRLRYLLQPPSGPALSEFRARVARLVREADKLGVVLVGQGSCGTDAAIWLCGVERLVRMALDQPDMFRALLDVIHEWDKRNVEVLLDSPVDLVIRRGYYEGTTFWSPDLFRRFFAPRIKELTNTVHQAGKLMGYTMSVGLMPLLDQFVEIGYDAHILLDPIPNGRRIDLVRVKSAFAGKVAVIGGLNAPITLERGTRQEIRQEVFDAVHFLGPSGGLALTPAEAIFASTPWQSIEYLIEAWKEVREYPIRG